MPRFYRLAILLLALALAATVSAAPQAVLEVREYAGLDRVAEPVIVPGSALLKLLGDKVDTTRLTVTDAEGRPVPCQVDERDGGFYYEPHPNRVLDPNDELVFQASLPALGTARFIVALAAAPPDLAGQTDLAVGPNPKPQENSSDVVAGNAFLEFGVRGWPADKARWSGGGVGRVTTLKLGGRQQVFQSEAHQWTLNTNDVYDQLYDTLEVVSAGPVRVLLQVSGPRFEGRKTGWWGRANLWAEDGQARRTYALYAGTPWLVITEAIRTGKLVHPRLTAITRFWWRPGGSPFNKDTKLYLPSASGADISTFLVPDKEYGGTLDAPAEPWAAALSPDGRPVPAFFFEPKKVWRLWSSTLEPWMRKGWDESGNYNSGKCVMDVDWAFPEAQKTGAAEWSYGVWGTDQDDPAALRDRYRALMVKPLSAAVAVLAPSSAAAVSDPLAVPPGAVAALQKDLGTLKDRAAALGKFNKDFPTGDEAALQGIRDYVQGSLTRVQRLVDAFQKQWPQLDSRARHDFLADWQAWQSRPLQPEIWAQQFDLYAASGKGSGYRLFVTDTYQKVFATRRVPGEIGGKVDWQLARREGRSVQLALVPLMTPLDQVQVAITDLKAEKGPGLIPAEAWDRYLVGDIQPPAGVNRAWHLPEDTRWPDPLMPLTAFDCPGHQARSVVLTLNVPVRTVPGVYTGEITVTPQGLPPTKVPVRVRVINFTLPERRTMFWDSWWDLDTVARHYGEYADLEHFEAHMQTLAKYRAVPGLYGWAAMAGKWLEVWREEDGSLTFDFSKLDPWIEITQRYGNLWNPNGSCNSGWFSVFHADNLWNVVKDRVTGKTLTRQDLPQMSALNPKYTLIYEEFMRAYVDHLREKGWLDTGWHEKWDEPVGERIEMCKEHHAYLHQLVPGLHLFNWGMRPVTDDWGWGVTDAWAPNLSAYYDELPGIERARREGVKVFTYTCGTSAPDAWPTVKVPDMSIFDPNVQRRAYAWIFDKLQFDGMLVFMMNGWPRQTPVAPNGACDWSHKRETRWPASEWVVDDYATFWWVYPGPDGTIYPTLRLDALRDGMQDYEYLYAARQLLKKQPNEELAKLVEVDDALVAGTSVYSQDPAAYDARRLAIGRFLDQ